MALRMHAMAALPCQLICSTPALNLEMIFFVFFMLYANVGCVLQKGPDSTGSLGAGYHVGVWDSLFELTGRLEQIR